MFEKENIAICCENCFSYGKMAMVLLTDAVLLGRDLVYFLCRMKQKLYNLGLVAKTTIEKNHKI